MKQVIFISFWTTIFFSINLFAQSIDEKIIFDPISKEDRNLVANLKNYLKISFIKTPQKSIKYLPQEVFEVIMDNASSYLSIKEVEGMMKQAAIDKKSRLPSRNKKFIIHEILNRVERENHIIYIVSHSIKEANEFDRLSQSIKREETDKENTISISMKTICIYNKFNEKWQYFEHNNNKFSKQVLIKMFQSNTANAILDFNTISQNE